MSKKETPIDDLAHAMGTGFRELNEHLDGTQTIITEMRADMREIQTDIKGVKEKIEVVRFEVNGISFDNQKIMEQIRNLEIHAFGSTRD